MPVVTPHVLLSRSVVPRHILYIRISFHIVNMHNFHELYIWVHSPVSLTSAWCISSSYSSLGQKPDRSVLFLGTVGDDRQDYACAVKNRTPLQNSHLLVAEAVLRFLGIAGGDIIYCVKTLLLLKTVEGALMDLQKQHQFTLTCVFFITINFQRIFIINLPNFRPQPKVSIFFKMQSYIFL